MFGVLNTQIAAVNIFTNFFNIKVFWTSGTPAVAKCCFSSNFQQSLIGQDLLFIKRSRSQSDTPHSVGLSWRSNQPDAWASTWQHTTLTRGRQPYTRQDSNPKSQPSERPQTPHLRSRGHWDKRQDVLLEDILNDSYDVFSKTAAFFFRWAADSNLDLETGCAERVLSSFSPLPLKCWDGLADYVTITWTHFNSNLLFISHINRRYTIICKSKEDTWICHT